MISSLIWVFWHIFINNYTHRPSKPTTRIINRDKFKHKSLLFKSIILKSSSYEKSIFPSEGSSYSTYCKLFISNEVLCAIALNPNLLIGPWVTDTILLKISYEILSFNLCLCESKAWKDNAKRV